MIEAPPKIRLKNLHKRFGDKVVLNGLNLDVQKGESVVIMGGSGSGKSVSLKCLLGLLTPDGGDIQIDGKSIIGISEDDRRVQMQINKKRIRRRQAKVEFKCRSTRRHCLYWERCLRQPTTSSASKRFPSSVSLASRKTATTPSLKLPPY